MSSKRRDNIWPPFEDPRELQETLDSFGFAPHHDSYWVERREVLIAADAARWLSLVAQILVHPRAPDEVKEHYAKRVRDLYFSPPLETMEQKRRYVLGAVDEAAERIEAGLPDTVCLGEFGAAYPEDAEKIRLFPLSEAARVWRDSRPGARTKGTRGEPRVSKYELVAEAIKGTSFACKASALEKLWSAMREKK